MENQDLTISIKTIWILIIGNFLITFVGVFAKWQHWEFAQVLLTIALILFFTSWVVIISDIEKQKIHKKTFWLLSMFILPTIAPIFYLIRRKNIIIK